MLRIQIRILMGTLLGDVSRSAVMHSGTECFRIQLAFQVRTVPAKAVRHSGNGSNRGCNNDCPKEHCDAFLSDSDKDSNKDGPKEDCEAFL